MTDIPAELRALTPKQQVFVLSYIQEKNGTKAARAAGYHGTDASLGVEANRQLRKAKVQSAINGLTAR